MIRILTLFLGLTSGLQTIDLAVQPPVVRVELRLDGETLATLEGRPWRLDHDFGDELRPHLLEALGFDAEGNEVARDRRTLNLRVAQAEAKLVLERDASGRAAAARLVWQSVEFERPAAIEVRFDGERLAVDDARRISLPRHDPRRIHFLTAELTFPDGTTARADLAWGGSLAETVSAQNTALPVVVDRRRALRRPEEAQALVVAGGAPARVVAIDQGEADVVVVRERSAAAELAALRAKLENRLQTDAGAGQTGLHAGDRLFVVDTTPEPVRAGRQRYNLFRATPPQPGERGGLAWQLTHLVLAKPPPGPQQVADAVATAGMLAAGGARPRAVLLVLGPGAEDASLHDPREVRRLLARLRVPLEVWFLARDPAELPPGEREGAGGEDRRRRRLAELRAAWGAFTVIDGVVACDVAARALRRSLARQRLIWVDGEHMPENLALAGETAGVRLAGVAGAGAPGEGEASEDATVAEAAADTSETPAPDLAETAAAKLAEAPAADVAEPPRPEGEPAPPAERTAFLETVDVNLVEVTVVAVDRRGDPVVDLGRDDFEVFDDGRPVELESFARVEPPPAPGEAPPDSSAESPPAAPPPLSLVLYFDDVSLEPAARARALRDLRPFVTGQLAAGARIMAAVWDGALRVSLPFSDRPQEIADALDGIGERFATGGRRVYADAFEHRRALDAIEATLVTLAGVPGRKALLYVGGGIPFVPAGDLIRMEADYAAVDIRSTNKSDWMAELWSRDATARFAEILARANAAGITVHTLDAAGVRDERGVEAEVDRFHAPEAQYQPLRDQMTVDPLHYMAETTGGVAIVNANRLERPLARLSDELATYYSLAYRLPEASGREYRTIEVQVRRRGVRLRHRRGYRSRGPGERLAERVVSALHVPPAPAGDNPLAAEVELGAGRPQGDGILRVPVQISIPVSGLALLLSAGGRRGRLALVLAAIDSQGDRSPVQRTEVPIELPADEVEGGAATVFTLAAELAVGPGTQRVAVGLRDEIGGTESVLVLPAEDE